MNTDLNSTAELDSLSGPSAREAGRSRRRSSAAVVAVSAAGALAMLASPAAAVDGGTLVERWAYYGATPPVTAGFVGCPAGYLETAIGASSSAGLKSVTPVSNGTAGHAAGEGSALSVQAVCTPSAQLPGVSYSNDISKSATPDYTWSGEVLCPSGYLAVGGGGATQTSTGVETAAALHSDTPTGDGSGWIYTATSSDAQQLSVTVACVRKPRAAVGRPAPVVMVNRTVYLPTGAASAGNGGYATCPSGYVAMSGGAYLTNQSGSAQLTASYRTHQPDGWWAAATNHGASANAPNMLQVTAMCTQSAPVTKAG